MLRQSRQIWVSFRKRALENGVPSAKEPQSMGFFPQQNSWIKYLSPVKIMFLLIVCASFNRMTSLHQARSEFRWKQFNQVI